MVFEKAVKQILPWLIESLTRPDLFLLRLADNCGVGILRCVVVTFTAALKDTLVSILSICTIFLDQILLHFSKMSITDLLPVTTFLTWTKLDLKPRSNLNF